MTQGDVERPSAAARAAGTHPGLARALAGDLDCILMKALEREPAHRYAGVQDLQCDLQDYLAGLPVKARAPSWSYRFAKFARRRAVGLGIATVCVIGLAVVAVVYGMQERRVA